MSPFSRMDAGCRVDAVGGANIARTRFVPPEAPLAKHPARPTILVVCTANVCRSPRAEFELRGALARTPGFESVHVASVGTDAPRAAHICDLVRESGESEGLARDDWLEFADNHRSAKLTAAKVAQAKLILTAGSDHRAAVARVSPAARARTFTLREALWLGHGFSTSAAGADAVDAFAAYANGNRGVRTPPQDRRRLLPWTRSTSDALSIADTHGAADKVHRATIVDVANVAGRLGSLLTTAG